MLGLQLQTTSTQHIKYSLKLTFYFYRTPFYVAAGGSASTHSAIIGVCSI